MSGAIHLTKRLDAYDVQHIHALKHAGTKRAVICQRYAISRASCDRVLDPEGWSDEQKYRWDQPLPEKDSFISDQEVKDISKKIHEDQKQWLQEQADKAAKVRARKAEKEVRQNSLITEKLTLLEQVRRFDGIKQSLAQGLGHLRDETNISEAFYNEMVDELLDVLTEWKR